MVVVLESSQCQQKTIVTNRDRLTHLPLVKHLRGHLDIGNGILRLQEPYGGSQIPRRYQRVRV